MQELRYLEDVATLALYRDACIGCGLCTVVCPRGVFVLEAGKARIQDLNACMECGACVTNCPTRAVSVTPGVG